MENQSAIFPTTDCITSDAHLKQMSQILRSIASATRSPAEPDILDATHLASSSEKSRGTVFGTSLYSLKEFHAGSSIENPGTKALFLEDAQERSHGIGIGILRE